MSVNIQATVLPHHRRSDGSNIVRIRVTHKGKSKWVKTNIVLYPDELTKAGKPKSGKVMRQANDLVERMQKVADRIDMYKLQVMSVDDVVAAINKGLSEPEKFVLDFIEFGREVASRKSKGNSSTYIVAMNALERFFGRHPDISEITVRNLRAFEKYLSEENVVKVDWRTGKQKTIRKKKGDRAASLYLSAVRHVYKTARIEFNDPDLGLFPIPNDPFEYYSVPKTPSARHRNVPPEVIQLMIDTRQRYEGRVRMAVDAFLISFGLYGMNAADMFSCSKPNRNGILYYNRQKTANRRDDHAEMYVRIEPCIRDIMKDYADRERCFDYHRRYKDKDIFTTALNQGLRRWIKDNGQEDFTFYSARHSWATIGRSKRCNISKDIIAAGLCHVDEGNRTNDIYINMDWELLWDAQRVILGTFDWK